MTGSELALVLGGLASFVTALIAGLRAFRSDKVTESERQTAMAMQTQGELIKTLQEEIKRIRKEFEEERQAWYKERLELKSEVSRLKERVVELEKDHYH